MEIEDKIRTRIEAILINDARNTSEIRKMAAGDEPLEEDELAEERNLYHRIINSYRNAVGEVNKLLEQNIGSLSGFYRIVENIKEKEDFQEICSQIVDCVLQDFGADYCSLLFPESDDTLCLEAIREDRKFLRIHSKSSLLGDRKFEQDLMRMAEESSECLNIEDVYKEPRFNAVDFPGVVRSVLCLPITLRGTSVGFLVVSHSLPKFFHDNHIRILRILSGMIAHLWLLHIGNKTSAALLPQASPHRDPSEEQDGYSVVLLEFEMRDPFGRRGAPPKDILREIRSRLQNALEGRESILLYGEKELLVLMPGVTSELLPGRVRGLRQAFHIWKVGQAEDRRSISINLGFSVCNGEQDLSRTLEVASLVIHPERNEEPIARP